MRCSGYRRWELGGPGVAAASGKEPAASSCFAVVNHDFHDFDHIYAMDYGETLAAHVETNADFTIGCTLVRKDVAHELQRKRAIVIDSRPLFDRAFRKIADSLKDMGQAATS